MKKMKHVPRQARRVHFAPSVEAQQRDRRRWLRLRRDEPFPTLAVSVPVAQPWTRAGVIVTILATFAFASLFTLMAASANRSSDNIPSDA